MAASGVGGVGRQARTRHCGCSWQAPLNSGGTVLLSQQGPSTASCLLLVALHRKLKRKADRSRIAPAVLLCPYLLYLEIYFYF